MISFVAKFCQSWEDHKPYQRKLLGFYICENASQACSRNLVRDEETKHITQLDGLKGIE